MNLGKVKWAKVEALCQALICKGNGIEEISTRIKYPFINWWVNCCTISGEI